MPELLDLSIETAGRELVARKISAVELVSATLDRIRETEPQVHAYAHVAERALDTAESLDHELQSGTHRGPLHGVPVGVKDLCFTTDMPTEAGSRVLRGNRTTTDATVVARLRAAGAVIVGKTVTHEFAYGQNVPPTRNPWSLDSYPGGSSAGSGVAVAVRSAFAAIGTDTGGSIRIPASVNGVVGLKPTFGRVSRAGVIQMSPSLDHVGPLARTVGDCALVQQAIAGFDPADRTSIDAPLTGAEDLEQGAQGAVIGIEREYFFDDKVDPQVREAVERMAEVLEAAGARVVEIVLPELKLMPVVAMSILLADTSAYHRRALRDERREAYEPGTRMMLELGELIPATLYVTAQRARTRLCAAMRQAFDDGKLDALLAPTTPQATLPLAVLSSGLVEDESTPRLGDYVHPCFPANLTGQPALSVPCGFNDRGLPMGAQLIGRPFEEHVLFRIARAYERIDRWHERAPALELATPSVGGSTG
jgi:aspartyl-tRNA(Asn)/glutamyl-tRNA(Gln) amidotransferase subunit A